MIRPDRTTPPDRRAWVPWGAAVALLSAALLGAAPVVAAQGDGAQGASATIEPGHRAFAAQYMAAVASGDAQRMRALVHPRSLACMTEGSRDFFDDVLARSMRPAAFESHHVTSVRRIDRVEPPGVPPAYGAYPVPPTHRIQIDVSVGPNRSRTVIRDLAAVDGVWLVLVVCPTEAGLAAFRQVRQAEAAEQARARELAAGVPGPLAAELRALLQSGRRIEAIRRYRQATGEGLAVSRRVVELLEATRP